MSRSIDERIVEMRFDNKQFESGVKESLGSLHKLEDALNSNISSDSLDEIARSVSNIDMSGLINSVNLISDRFSTFGIVGMRVITNLVDGLMNGLNKAIHTVSDSIVSGGIKRAMNLENARFQLQGLISDQNEVKAVMNDALDSVNDTAYSYDVAAKAASQFAATGLKSGQEMQQALKGIAGVAATTNTDYEGVSRIFTQVAGQGRLMGDQLLQLSNRGMNAAAILKDYFNGVSNDSIKASKGVEETIKSLTGASNTFKGTADEFKESLSSAYEAAAEKFNEEYKLRQKILNAEYKDLQKTLSKEYDARKKAYDDEYKALKESLDKEYKAKQKELNEAYNSLKKALDAEYDAKKEAYDKEYEDLQKSLDAEITAQQKANSERIKEANKAYQEDVSNYKKAAEEKIALIDKEYTESLKLIDEEAYKRTKSLEDQIEAIDKAAEEEEKARKQAERNTKLTELKSAVDLATSAEAREKAAKALLEYQQKIKEEELAESRKAQKAKLKEEIAAIKEEAAEKKQAAKESRDSDVKNIQDETNETLSIKAEEHEKEQAALQETLQAEIDQMKEARNQKLADLKASQNAELVALKESQTAQLEAVKEQQTAELEALRESHDDRLSSLKETQSDELEALKEGQTAQLEALKEKQSEQLEALKKSNNAKLKELKKTNDEALKSFSDFSTNAGITEGAIRDMVSKGLVDFNTFAEAMAYTFGDHAKDANHTFTGIVANIKSALAKIGELFIGPLIAQDSAIVIFLNVVREKINEFKNALGATNGFAKEFTDFVLLMAERLTKVVENFKVANILVKDYGNGIKETFDLSKVSMKKLGDTAKEVAVDDIYTPFNAVMDVVYTLINLGKGLLTVLKPIGEAFYDIFLATASAEGFYKFIEHIRELSEGLALSDKNSQNLKKAFTGLFSIMKSTVGIFARLIKAIIGHKNENVNLGDSILDLIGFFGDLLTKLADWLNTSPEVEKALSILADGFSKIAEVITKIVNIIINEKPWENFVNRIEELSGIDLSKVASSIESFLKSILNIPNSGDAISIGINVVEGIVEGIKNGANNLIKAAIELASTLLHTVMDYLGIHSPSTEGMAIGENFILGIVNGLKTGFDKIKGKAAELANTLLGEAAMGFTNFEDIISRLISLLGGGALVYLLVQVGRAFGGINTALSSIFDKKKGLIANVISTLGSLKDVADAYTKDLKADAFMKTAIGVSIGIGVITAALIALSKQSPDTLLAASASLSLVAYVFGQTVERLMWVSSKTSTVESALNTAATGLSKSLKNLGKAVKIKAVGSAVKDFAIAIGIIIADIAAIYLLYKHDESGFKNAVGVVAGIAGFLMLMIGIMSALGQEFNKGMIAFAKVSVGVLALALAVSITIGALKDVLALNFNWKKDYNKILLLASLFGLVTVLALAIGGASAIAGEGKIKTGPLLAMCAMIATSVWALKSVMDMRLKNDWPIKLGILAGLFAALGTLMLMIGAAANIGGGNGLKATGTILAMCAFIATAIGAIAILATFPAEALKKGALALGGILLTLGAIILAASNLTNPGAGETVMAMAVMVGVIVTAIAILSFISWEKMIPGALSLSLVLLALAATFAAISKITSEEAFDNVVAMAIMVGIITAALAVLTNVGSWEDLIASALAMSAVLLAIGGTFKIINSTEEIGDDKLLAVILGVLTVAAIGQILRLTSDLPWENMLAAGGAISAVLLAIGASFKIINSTEEIEDDKMLAFIVGAVAAGIIGLILRLFVSETPWESLLGMAASISLVLVAIGAAFAIINATKVDDGSIAAFLVGVIGVMGIAMALEKLQGMAWQDLLGSAISISIVLIALSVAMVICSAAGASVKAALLGLVALDGFILNMILILSALGGIAQIPHIDDLLDAGGGLLSKIGKTLGNFVGSIVEGISEAYGRALENIGLSLSKFMVNAMPFFMGLKMIDDDAVKAAGALASIVIALAVAEFINGITNLMSVFMGTNDMPTFGQKLVAFGKSVALFDQATRGVDGENVSKVAQAAKSLIDIAKEIPNSGGLLGKVMGNNDIDVFGQKLAAFGPSIAIFDMTTRAITDTSHWKQIADGMKYLTDMAAYIPNSGGLAGAVMGDNDIDVFGQKLKAFAPSILAFHNQVQSISDVSSWKRVADGTSYLVDMAKLIPNAGGLAGLIAGDNDIAEFGKSVLKFGIYLEEFNKHVNAIPMIMFSNISSGMMKLIAMCKSLKDVDPDVMINFSDNMAKMAKDGLTSFINVFQTQTALAVNAIKSAITQINSTVQNNTTVQMAFTNLATKSMNAFLTEIVSKISLITITIDTMFTTITTLMTTKSILFKTFGVSHGESYAAGIFSVLPTILTGVIATIEGIIITFTASDIRFRTSGINNAKAYSVGILSVMSTILAGIMTILNAVILTFTASDIRFRTSGINNAKAYSVGILSVMSTILAGIMTILNAVILTFTASDIRFRTSGINNAKAYSVGILSVMSTILAGIMTILNAVILTFTASDIRFRTSGINNAKAYKEGLSSVDVDNAAMKLTNAAVRVFNDRNDTFEECGENAAKGFAKGIKNKVDEVAEEARKLAKEAKTAIEEELDENSPSKVLRQDGQYAGEGFALGLHDKILEVRNAALRVGQSSVNAFGEAIADISDITEDLDPVITPIVDLSDVMKAADSINDLFSKAVTNVNSNVASASNSMNRKNTTNGLQNIQNDDGSGNTNVTFIQNNNSPKALSRIDIYRQTRNQLAQFREAVERT